MRGLTFFKNIIHISKTTWVILGITLLLIIFSELSCGLLLTGYYYYKNIPIDHRVMAYKGKNRMGK